MTKIIVSPWKEECVIKEVHSENRTRFWTFKHDSSVKKANGMKDKEEGISQKVKQEDKVMESKRKKKHRIIGRPIWEVKHPNNGSSGRERQRRQNTEITTEINHETKTSQS